MPISRIPLSSIPRNLPMGIGFSLGASISLMAYTPCHLYKSFNSLIRPRWSQLRQSSCILAPFSHWLFDIVAHIVCQREPTKPTFIGTNLAYSSWIPYPLPRQHGLSISLVAGVEFEPTTFFCIMNCLSSPFIHKIRIGRSFISIYHLVDPPNKKFTNSTSFIITV